MAEFQGTVSRCSAADFDDHASGTGKSMIHKADVNVKPRSDQMHCNITGIAILSSGKVVLADYQNKTLKLVDMKMKVVIEEKELDSELWHITTLPEDQIAVAQEPPKKILIMTTAGKLSILRNIDVNRRYRSVAYHQECLYVLCKYPNTVYILDMKGNIQKTILMENWTFANTYIAVFSKDHTFLYVSNFEYNTIARVTLHDEIYAVYKHEECLYPMGIVVLEDGSLLVCCSRRNVIFHHVSADLVEGNDVMGGLSYPTSIGYSADRNQIYVGGIVDHLKVFV